MRQNVRHPASGKRLNQPGVTDQRFGLVFRAPVAGKKPVICLDDLRWNQPFEQVLDADGVCGYH